MSKLIDLTLLGNFLTQCRAAFAPKTHTHAYSTLTGRPGNATTSAGGLMSAADKAKLDGVAAQANKYVLPQATASSLGGVKVDAALSASSANPVQNKAVNTALAGKADTAHTHAYMASDDYFKHCLYFHSDGTPAWGYVLKTKIPAGETAGHQVVPHIKVLGYAYGAQTNIELDLVSYNYAASGYPNAINFGATSTGGWAPSNIYLDDVGGYRCWYFKGASYYTSMDFFCLRNTGPYSIYADWTCEDVETAPTFTSHCVEVPFRPIKGSAAQKAESLATSRTIWGQSFNGSANVSGALSGATTITASGAVTGASFNVGAVQYGATSTMAQVVSGNNEVVVANSGIAASATGNMHVNYRTPSGMGRVTEWFLHDGTGSGYASIKAGSFVMNGSDASHVLLGNGGHKAVSDFAPASHTHVSGDITNLKSKGDSTHAVYFDANGAAQQVSKVAAAAQADNAAKATADGSGNNIVNTYETKAHATATFATKSDMANALHFRGITTTALSDGASTPSSGLVINNAAVTTFTSGDVVMYGEVEYLYNAGKWHELGDAASFVRKSSVAARTTTLAWGASKEVANIDGKAINVALPANPNTDTKNTAGASDTSSKLFIVGATAQGANPQTYSQDTAYVGTDGCLYSGSAKVLTAHQSVSNGNPTLAWGGTATVGTIGGTALTVKMPANPNTDTNTTYTFASGSAGSFSVTPSGGSAQAVSIGKPATAGTADKVGTTTVGGAAKPIYLYNGTPTACSATVGATTKPIYMADGTLQASSSTIGSGVRPMYMSSGTLTASSSTAGAFNRPVYLNGGNLTQVASVGEAFLSWGGQNFTGQYGPVDAAMVPALGANRTAFVPAEKVSVAYSTDGGSTWTDYGCSNATKVGMFTNFTGGAYSGHRLPGSTTPTTNDRLCVTLASSGAVYTQLNKFVIYLTTNGSNNCWVTIEKRLQSNVEAGTQTWETVCSKVPVAGWSGYNVVNTGEICTYGNQKASQYGEIRFIFGADTAAPSAQYGGLYVYGIQCFGGMGWTTPSNMAKEGHLYTYDAYQNASFPSGVTAGSLIKRGSSDSYVLLGGGGQAALSSLSSSHTHANLTLQLAGTTQATYTGAGAKTFNVPAATTSAAGLISAADKQKLDGVAAGANNYSLPTASANTLGGIKVGANLTISGGVLAGTPDTKYTHPTTSGNKHIPSGGSSGQILRWSSDGTAAWGADTDTNTTYAFASGLSGSFTVTPSGGSAQAVSVGKPATAGTADKVGSSLVVKLNGGTTEDTNLFTYNGSSAKTVNVTPSGIGAAPASHGHSDLLRVDGTNGTDAGVSTLINKLSEASATPQDADYYVCQYAGGGTATKTYHRRTMSALWAWIKGKGDAVYAALTHTHTKSQITDFPTAIKNPAALTLQMKGTTSQTYDGSSAKTFNVTAAGIGAAAASHTHTASQITDFVNKVLENGYAVPVDEFDWNTNISMNTDGTPTYPIQAASMAYTYGDTKVKYRADMGGFCLHKMSNNTYYGNWTTRSLYGTTQNKYYATVPVAEKMYIHVQTGYVYFYNGTTLVSANNGSLARAISKIELLNALTTPSGVNLLPNAENLTGWNGTLVSNALGTFPGRSLGTGDFYYTSGSNVDAAANSYYTLTFWAKKSTAAAASLLSYFHPSCAVEAVSSTGQTWSSESAGDGAVGTTLATDTKWHRYWVRWKTAGSVTGNKSVIVGRINTSGVTVVFALPRLEKSGISSMKDVAEVAAAALS